MSGGFESGGAVARGAVVVGCGRIESGSGGLRRLGRKTSIQGPREGLGGGRVRGGCEGRCEDDRQ